MFKPNPLTATDFYKVDHRSQYPKGTELVYSNLTPRSNKLTTCHNSPFYDGKMVFFGLQDFIKSFLIDTFNENFFNQPKPLIMSQYQKRIENALGKNAITYEHIEALHDLGYLPIEIKALAEGNRAQMGIPVLTIKNTLPEFFWLTNFLETILSAELWKLCNNATIAFEYKRILMHYALKTGASLDFIKFQGHDFSFRGMSGYDDASKSGLAHLTCFVGSDTIPAIDRAEYSYNANSDKELIAVSVSATEHSVMCLNTKEKEFELFKRLITEVYPVGIVSIVSDTWDLWKVCTEYLPKLKDVIMQRDGKVVIRPDSGDPVDIICGLEKNFKLTIEDYVYCQDLTNDDHKLDVLNFSENYRYKNGDLYYEFEEKYEYGEHSALVDWESGQSISEYKGVIELLWETFGGTINEKGYKELDPHIGCIYGDSITIERANTILNKLEQNGFASSNIVFGIGSYTYNYSTRDCFSLAVKSTYGVVSGEARAISKCPITDSGTKHSASGLLAVIKNNKEEFELIQNCTIGQEQLGCLTTVFKDGHLLLETSLADVRNRLDNELLYLGIK